VAEDPNLGRVYKAPSVQVDSGVDLEERVNLIFLCAKHSADVDRVLGDSEVGRLRWRTRNVDEGIGDLDSRNLSDDGTDSP